MRAENARMKQWLAENGIVCTPKYIRDGSMRGCWRLDDGQRVNGVIIGLTWWGNKELQQKLTKLGFVDFDGNPLGDYSGNGGKFSVFVRLQDKYAEGQLRYGTDDFSAIY